MLPQLRCLVKTKQRSGSICATGGGGPPSAVGSSICT